MIYTTKHFDLSDTGTGRFQFNYVNIMAANALATCVAKS